MASGQTPSSKYRTITRIGGGGMAEVFLTLAEGPAGVRKLVVLKKIQRGLAHDPDVLAMFLDEARLAARFNHPNVVQSYEVGVESGEHFLCMEHLDGQPWSAVRRRLGRADGLSLGMELRVLCEALAGLHYAHQLADYDGAPLSVIHRDVSPPNIFVTYDGQVKVIDFGIAKALDCRHHTGVGQLKGKITYMAPEQAAREPVDHRADVFSAGVILWEILAGRRLFQGSSFLTIVRRIMAGDLPSPRVHDPAIPDRLVAICARAMARRREDRHASAAELQHDLEEVLASLPPPTSLRELGALMSARFGEERRQLREQVRDAVTARVGADARLVAPAGRPPARRWLQPIALAALGALLGVLAFWARARLTGLPRSPGGGQGA
jgi:eukaryotic-like serine/threonine-protein kinase